MAGIFVHEIALQLGYSLFALKGSLSVWEICIDAVTFHISPFWKSFMGPFNRWIHDTYIK